METLWLPSAPPIKPNDINDLGLIEESEVISQTDGEATNNDDDEEDLSEIVGTKDETRSTEDDYIEPMPSIVI